MIRTTHSCRTLSTCSHSRRPKFFSSLIRLPRYVVSRPPMYSTRRARRQLKIYNSNSWQRLWRNFQRSLLRKSSRRCCSTSLSLQMLTTTRNSCTKCCQCWCSLKISTRIDSWWTLISIRSRRFMSKQISSWHKRKPIRCSQTSTTRSRSGRS